MRKMRNFIFSTLLILSLGAPITVCASSALPNEYIVSQQAPGRTLARSLHEDKSSPNDLQPEKDSPNPPAGYDDRGADQNYHETADDIYYYRSTQELPANEGSAKDDEAQSDPIIYYESDQYPDKILVKADIYDLNTGEHYTLDDFRIEKDHVYRLTLVLYSEGDKIENVKLYANLPDGDDNSAIFIVRDMLSGAPLTKVIVTSHSAPEETPDDFALALTYLEGSAIDNQFSASFDKLTDYYMGNLTNPENGMAISQIYNQMWYSEYDRVLKPYTIIMDFQAGLNTRSTEEAGAKTSVDYWATRFAIGGIIIFMAVMIVVFINKECRQKRDEQQGTGTEDS